MGSLFLSDSLHTYAAGEVLCSSVHASSMALVDHPVQMAMPAPAKLGLYDAKALCTNSCTELSVLAYVFTKAQATIHDIADSPTTLHAQRPSAVQHYQSSDIVHPADPLLTRSECGGLFVSLLRRCYLPSYSL